jgi:hypothetical protein|tara:strand:+ start:646 stop:828 length:183 start_codon:yes stop_codon:yes gene_type:complete
MKELQRALISAQQELELLPEASTFCNEDQYQDNLELRWHRQELEENIVKYKLDIEWLKNN